MIKFKKVVLISIVAGSVFSSSLMAGKDDSNSQGASNGQPFLSIQSAIDAEAAARSSADLALQSAIDAEEAARVAADAAEKAARVAEDALLQIGIATNADGVLSNAANIAAINNNFNNINTQISDLQAAVNQAETGIDNNAAAIAIALTRISATEGNIDTLQANLANLAAQHKADNNAIADIIADINAELVSLNDRRVALSADLNAQLQALRGSVDTNASNINDNIIAIILLNGQVTLINSSIDDLNTAVQQLETDQAANIAAIADLTTRITQLEDSNDPACGNSGGGSLVADNGTGAGESYCYNTEDTVQVRARKACESHFGVGECAIITGGYQSQQYGQAGQSGYDGTIHWHWDNHPAGHCGPFYVVGDVVSRGWCGSVLGNFLN